LQSKCKSSKQLSALDKYRRADVEAFRRGLHCVAPYRFPHRLEQDLARPAEQSTDDHALGIDEIAQACDGDPDLAAGIGYCPAAAQVARHRKLDDSRQAGNLAVKAPYQLNDRRA
jgi:hypothetical protein